MVLHAITVKRYMNYRFYSQCNNFAVKSFKMLKYFRGCWKLFREIRSLDDKHYIAIVNEAVASFQPWSGSENLVDSSTDSSSTQNTSTDTTATETTSNGGTSSKKSNKQWLLYRESGKLDNFDFPAASGQFTRQYLYKFPEINSEKQKHLEVYHCSKSTLKFTDLDPLNSNFDPTAFSLGDFFHDLLFPETLNWETFPMTMGDSLTAKGSKEPVTANSSTESMTLSSSKDPLSGDSRNAPFTGASHSEPLTASGQHLCGRDVYKGLFQIYSVDNFQTVWKVTGPEKSFQIVSIYTRFS